MAMVEEAVLDGVGVILTLGMLAARSPMVEIPLCSVRSAVNTAVEIGVSWRDCILFWAVTMTSSRACADPYRGRAARAMARVLRVAMDTMSLLGTLQQLVVILPR